MTLEIKRNNTDPSILLANPRLKIIGSTDGTFPARGHHQPGEMYGVWFHPYKLLDGFKMHVKEKGLESSNLQLLADGITVGISGNTYEYNQSVGHSHFDIKRNDYIPVHGTGFVSEYEFKNKDLQKTHTLFWQFTLNVNIRKVWDPDLENVFHNSNLQNTFDLERQKILVFDEKLHVGFALSLNQAVKNADFCQEKLPLTTRTKDQIKILGKLEVKAGETKKLRFNMLGFTGAWNEKIEENLTLLTNLSHTAISEQRKIWLNGWLDQSRWIDLNTKKENYKEKSGNLSYGIDTNNREKTLELTRELLPWLRFNTACLEQDTVKRRGLTAGQPEYPWWFTCDSYYACQGLLCAGQFELVRETIEIILHSCQENEPKYKVPHEITTAGKIVHPGNMQEQAQILSLIAYYFSWTNDRSWLLQNRDSILNIYQLMDEATQGGSTFVKGYGITEIAGLNLRLIDTAVYMIEAYEAMTILMRILKQDEVENTRIKAEKMKHHFLQAYWLEDEGLFADCLASYEELEDVIEIIIQDLNLSKEQTQSLYSSIEVAKKNAKELKPWLLNRNWVIWTPFETKLAMQRQAEMALPQVMTADYLGPWGIYLDGVSKNHMMTISTGVLIRSLFNYGFYDQGINLLSHLNRNFSRVSPGTWQEMNPDYGCFMQAWTNYGYEIGIVEGLWGIKVDAISSNVFVNPAPSHYLEGTQIKNVRVFDGFFSLACKNNTMYVTKAFEGNLFVGKQKISSDGSLELPWPHDRFIPSRF